MNKMKDINEIIGTQFEDKCPICGNKHLENGECVYWESGDSWWDYYTWYCPKCQSTILEEVKTDCGAVIDAKGQETGNWYSMSICPRCGEECDELDNEWYQEEYDGDLIEVNHRTYYCPDCGIKFQGKELWDVIEETVYAVRDKHGRIAESYSYLAGQGPDTKRYL